jgi:hypothetical protein
MGKLNCVYAVSYMSCRGSRFALGTNIGGRALHRRL